MPYFEIIWDGESESHLDEHGVTIEEFGEAVTNPDRLEARRSSGRRIVFGGTSTGKCLACVYEQFDELQAYPVTAYELED
jgi:uncharacterized DUF497 family protein